MSEFNDRLRRDLVFGVLRQLHLEKMCQRFNPRFVQVAFNTVNGGISIGLIALVALITQETFIFPSLGASAFLLFHVPLSTTASPRNVITAHLIGALVGWSSLALFGLLDAPPVIMTGMDWQHACAAALSLGLTSGLMTVLNVAHPPAGATTLIVSLGFMPELQQVPVLLAGVSLLLAQAFVLNRLAGLEYPLWRGDSSRSFPF